MVAPVHRRPGVLRHERPAGPGPGLRPGRPGPRLRAGPGPGHRPGAGVPGAALPGPHRGAAADRGAMAPGPVPAGGPGPVPGQAAGGRDAARDRGRLRRLRHAAVPPAGQRPGHAVQLPRLGGAVQASRRGLLRAGRGVRPRSVRHAGLAREEPARAPRGAAAASGRWRGPGGGSGPAAASLRGRVLVRPAEPGPAAGAGHVGWAVRPGPAAPHVPAPAGQGQGCGAGRHPAARLPGAGRR